MKILIYGLTGSYGGVEKYILDRIPRILMDASIDIAYPEKEIIEYEHVLKRYNVGIKYVARFSKPFSFYEEMKNLIIQEGYDYVYCNLSFSNAILYWAIKRAHAKLIVHAHNTKIDILDLKKRNLLTIYHYVSKIFFTHMIDQMFGCSNAASQWLFGNPNTSVIKKNAIDCKQFIFNQEIRNKKRIELNLNDEFVVGHVGRFTYQKNHEFLINIFYEIQKRYPSSKLLLIGNGPMKENIYRMAKRLKINDKILFLGLRQDVNELMQAMDCFILPSRFEGLAIVGIEAQSSGLQCYISDTVSSEIKITDLVHFCSLNMTPEKWADIVIKNRLSPRKNMRREIICAEYDLDTELDSYNIKKFIGGI